MKIPNRSAYHEYHILEKLEAGLVLTGAEAKSVRSGRIQLAGSYVRILDQQPWLINAIIPPYAAANPDDHQSDRNRQLLLHQKEILKLTQKIQTKGITLVPLAVYTKKNLVKLQIGLARSKKAYEKRAALKIRDQEREVERTLKDFNT